MATVRALLLMAVLILAEHARPDTSAVLNLTHTTSFVVFPADANAMGTLFGGKLLAEMDRTAGITARRLLYASKAQDAVTVAVNSVEFLKSAKVKDLIFITGKVTALGGRSITMKIIAEREIRGGERELLVSGEFVYVSYDVAEKKAVPHGLKLEK